MGGCVVLTEIRVKGSYLLELCFLVGFHIYLSICNQCKIFVALFSGTMKARKLKLGINMDNKWMYRAYQNWGQGPITHRSLLFSRFLHLCIYLSSIEHFLSLFSGTIKARKLKLGINMDNGWMYHAYRIRGHGPITLGVIFLGRFPHLFIYLSSKKNFHNTFLRNYESQKAETWYKHRQWVAVSCLPK